MNQFETFKEFNDAIEQWCVDNDVDLRINTKYHYTLMKDDFRIDIYPTNQRYHIVTQPQERGDWEILEPFLDKTFENARRE